MDSKMTRSSFWVPAKLYPYMLMSAPSTSRIATLLVTLQASSAAYWRCLDSWFLGFRVDVFNNVSRYRMRILREQRSATSITFTYS